MVPDIERNTLWRDRLMPYLDRAAEILPVEVDGKLTRMVGLTLEAVGCKAAIGGRCMITSISGENVEAEVVGFHDDKIYLMPVGDMQGIGPGARVRSVHTVYRVPVGDNLLGRVLDGAGKPLDNKGPLQATSQVPITGSPINPLEREPIHEPLDVGVAAINSLLTVGRGQRMGLFAGSGVGKSVLLGMMTRYTTADVIVVGMIGERGREVKEFVQNILGDEGMSRSVVVATPADTSPLMRLHGAMLATSIAEYFRDQGKQVLLLMDSLTRFAQAQREIALAVGEPPATKGYPPSVFAKLPQLVERAGTGGTKGGSITAFYTVLAEGDDQNDPIADAARAILDGHLVLSRDLAKAGHFPAIDIESSVSRVMSEIVSPEHQERALLFRKIYSTYQQNKDLISVGAYQQGSSPEIDLSIAMFPRLGAFLQQGKDESIGWEKSLGGLKEVMFDVENSPA
ncbi:MAG: flagellar protein export ATPase FliI [Gammaproteobacteria bacterium]